MFVKVDEDGNLTHVHNYVETIENSTCIKEGLKTYTCNCGDVYTETIAINSANHSGNIVNAGTESVHTKYSCCNATVSTKHSYTSTITKEATCEESGINTYSCSCGYKYTNEIPATGHNLISGVCNKCNFLKAGLYDANGNLLCAWENSGINIEIDYNGSSYKTDTRSGYYVLTKVYPNTRHIVFPNNIEYIGKYAFYECKNLTKVIFQKGIKEIKERVFEECTKLNNIVLPDGFEKIGPSAFGNCNSLTNITLPISLTLIDNSAFWSCDNLATVYYRGTEEQWKSSVYVDNTGNANNYFGKATKIYNYTN